jgi:BirA family biotin operon repressor/biotin-[acetyl-CoA-carboxylase] ligase
VSATLRRTIVGVGINVNQREFDPSIPNPVSMVQLLGKELNAEEVLQCFLKCLQKNYEHLRKSGAASLHSRYNSLLYRLNEYHTYALPSGERFKAEIVGTASSGALRLENEQGESKDYLFKEVEFVI